VLERVSSMHHATDLASLLRPYAPTPGAPPTSFADVLARGRDGAGGPASAGATPTGGSASLYEALVQASTRSLLASLGSAQAPGAKLLRDLLGRSEARHAEATAAAGLDGRGDVNDIYSRAQLKSLSDGFGPGDALGAALSRAADDRRLHRRQSSSLASFFV